MMVFHLMIEDPESLVEDKGPVRSLLIDMEDRIAFALQEADPDGHRYTVQVER